MFSEDPTFGAGRESVSGLNEPAATHPQPSPQPSAKEPSQSESFGSEPSRAGSGESEAPASQGMGTVQERPFLTRRQSVPRDGVVPRGGSSVMRIPPSQFVSRSAAMASESAEAEGPTNGEGGETHDEFYHFHHSESDGANANSGTRRGYNGSWQSRSYAGYSGRSRRSSWNSQGGFGEDGGDSSEGGNGNAKGADGVSRSGDGAGEFGGNVGGNTGGDFGSGTGGDVSGAGGSGFARSAEDTERGHENLGERSGRFSRYGENSRYGGGYSREGRSGGFRSGAGTDRKNYNDLVDGGEQRRNPGERGGFRRGYGGDRGSYGGDRGSYGGERRNYGGDRGGYSGDRGNYGGDRGNYSGDRGSYGNERGSYGGEKRGYGSRFNGGERGYRSGGRKPSGGFYQNNGEGRDYRGRAPRSGSEGQEFREDSGWRGNRHADYHSRRQQEPLSLAEELAEERSRGGLSSDAVNSAFLHEQALSNPTIGELQKLTMAELIEEARKVELDGSAELDEATALRQDLIFRILREKIRRAGLLYGEGTLEVLPDGFGFLRSTEAHYVSCTDDIYVSPSQVRRFRLKTGVFVSGQIRPPKENERYFALLRIEAVNYRDPGDFMRKRPFEMLTPVYPNRLMKLETTGEEITTRVLDMMTPFGFGQRGLLISPPQAGKTTLLEKVMQAARKNHPELYVFLLLINQRPEDLADARQKLAGLNCEVVGSTFDEPASRHINLAQMVLEKAKRMVESGADVLLLVDSLTHLVRACCLEETPSVAETASSTEAEGLAATAGEAEVKDAPGDVAADASAADANVTNTSDANTDATATEISADADENGANAVEKTVAVDTNAEAVPEKEPAAEGTTESTAEAPAEPAATETETAPAETATVAEGAAAPTYRMEASRLRFPKHFFSAAHGVAEGGSLSILATMLTETGNEFDEQILAEFRGTGNLEIVLDKKLADLNIWPSIALNQSGTLHEELLMDEETLAKIQKLRRLLSELHPTDMMNLLTNRLRRTNSNAEFLEGFSG